MSASAKPNTVELTLLGQKIGFRATQEDPEVLNEVLALVKERITEAELSNKKSGLAPHHIAIVALLNLAEEYIQSKKRWQENQKLLDEKVDAIDLILDRLSPPEASEAKA